MSNKVSNFPGPATKRKAEENKSLALNTKLLNELRNLPVLDRKDVSQIQNRLNEYFLLCERANFFPSVSSMALALGISRKTLWSWANEDSERGHLISSAREIINALYEQLGVSGSAPQIYLIFLQKCHFQYQDVLDVRAIQDRSLEQLPTREQILQSLPVLEDVENAD